MAGIAVSIYHPDYKTAIERTVTVTRIVQPRKEYKEIYEHKYKVYRSVIDGLSESWQYFKN